MIQLVDSDSFASFDSFDSFDSLESFELSEADDNLLLRNALICTEGDVGVAGDGLPVRTASVLSRDSGSATASAVLIVDDEERERRI